ncbi:MAG: STAS domain-containing protein [Lachnospiraceae bacterium]|nr:STAS domain-containing protein [Lachnospiraceae bacterium]
MLNIVKKQEGDVLTVKMEGRLDTNTSPEFQREVEPLLDGISELALDFEKVDYISSAGLRVLLTFEQELEEQDKKMVLCHVNDIIRDVFDVTGFLDILTIV